MRKKRTIVAAEEEQERMRRQNSQPKHSHFRQFISSVTSRSQSIDVSLRDLKSEVQEEFSACEVVSTSNGLGVLIYIQGGVK